MIIIIIVIKCLYTLFFSSHKPDLKTGICWTFLRLRRLFSQTNLLLKLSFLERPDNFLGLKANFEIKVSWTVAKFLAHKPVNLLRWLINSLCHCQNYWNFDIECNHGKHKTSFRARNVLETFEKRGPRSHFISRLSMIVRVNVVLNGTVVESDWRLVTCAVVIFREVNCITSVDDIKVPKSTCYW